MIRFQKCQLIYCDIVGLDEYQEKSLGKGGESQKKLTTQEGCEFKSSLTISPTSPQSEANRTTEDFRRISGWTSFH
jgi:hypothetical protein